MIHPLNKAKSLLVNESFPNPPLPQENPKSDPGNLHRPVLIGRQRDVNPYNLNNVHHHRGKPWIDHQEVVIWLILVLPPANHQDAPGTRTKCLESESGAVELHQCHSNNILLGLGNLVVTIYEISILHHPIQFHHLATLKWQHMITCHNNNTNNVMNLLLETSPRIGVIFVHPRPNVIVETLRDVNVIHVGKINQVVVGMAAPPGITMMVGITKGTLW
jgi:hypothetical protein